LEELNRVASVKPSRRSESSPALAPQKPEPEKIKAGCWWKSDSFGTLLEDVGGPREEDPIERPRNVQILYGKRW